MAATKTFQATISRTNGHGFQTRELPGQWLNLSRYASPPPEIPPAGTTARLTLDGTGFVRAIERLDGASVQPSLPELTNGVGQSTRLPLLHAAAVFLASRPEAKSTGVLSVAQSWEAWASQ